MAWRSTGSLGKSRRKLRRAANGCQRKARSKGTRVRTGCRPARSQRPAGSTGLHPGAGRGRAPAREPLLARRLSTGRAVAGRNGVHVDARTNARSGAPGPAILPARFHSEILVILGPPSPCPSLSFSDGLSMNTVSVFATRDLRDAANPTGLRVPLRAGQVVHPVARGPTPSATAASPVLSAWLERLP